MRDRNLLEPFSSHVDSDKGGNKSSKGRIQGFCQDISALLRGVELQRQRGSGNDAVIITFLCLLSKKGWWGDMVSTANDF